MTMTAGSAPSDTSRPGRHTGTRPIDLEIIKLQDALHDRDHDTAKLCARRWACIQPSDPNLARLANALLRTDDQDLLASFARMAVALTPADPSLTANRIHRAVKAGRPDRMPPHWMRDVMLDTQTLKEYIKQGDMTSAKAFLDQPNLAGHKRYMPEFRALRHFVRFNTDSDYRNNFSKHCIAIFPITDKPDSQTGHDRNPEILQSLIEAADWSEKLDTIVPASDLAAYPVKAEKRIRAGQLTPDSIPRSLDFWQSLIRDACMIFWQHQVKNNTIEDLFGIDQDRALRISCALSYHINEILTGPVLGPHYHSGNRGNAHAVFPLLSAVFYPKTIPENPTTKAGYLELGRPNFGTAFEPYTQHVRPPAGHLLVFPAFAFHGVIPIDESPRYSVNIDFYAHPVGATNFSVTNFFE